MSGKACYETEIIKEIVEIELITGEKFSFPGEEYSFESSFAVYSVKNGDVITHFPFSNIKYIKQTKIHTGKFRKRL